MPRNMSFAITTRQFKDRTKTVTRRLGWCNLKPGEIVNGVEKGMGLKKGEKIKRLGQIRIISVRQEMIRDITREDCIKEGFPEMSPVQFVMMFCKHNKVTPTTLVNRIEYEYL